VEQKQEQQQQEEEEQINWQAFRWCRNLVPFSLAAGGGSQSRLSS